MPGSMRQRGEDSWQLRVHAGRDPITSRKRYVERTFRGNKRGAAKALAALVTEVDQRVPRSTKEGTVGALLNEWLDHATPSFSPKTVATTRMYIDAPIIPAIGALSASKLTASDLDRFYRHLLSVGGVRGPYSPATIRRVHGIIRRALTQGVRWGWIDRNPAIDASPPRVPLRDLNPPSPGDVVRLFRLAEKSDPDLAVTRLHHGCRLFGCPSGRDRGTPMEGPRSRSWNPVDRARSCACGGKTDRGGVRGRRPTRAGGSPSMQQRSRSSASTSLERPRSPVVERLAG